MFKSIQSKILNYIVTSTILAIIVIGILSVKLSSGVATHQISEALKNNSMFVSQIASLECDRLERHCQGMNWGNWQKERQKK